MLKYCDKDGIEKTIIDNENINEYVSGSGVSDESIFFQNDDLKIINDNGDIEIGESSDVNTHVTRITNDCNMAFELTVNGDMGVGGNIGIEGDMVVGGNINQIGDLSDLTTTAKTDLVSAINEAAAEKDKYWGGTSKKWEQFETDHPEEAAKVEVRYITDDEGSGGLEDRVEALEAAAEKDKYWSGTTAEWEQFETDHPEEAAKVEVRYITDDEGSGGLEDRVEALEAAVEKDKYWGGTSKKWEQFETDHPEEAAKVEVRYITDDSETGSVVDAVKDGDMRAVTSNAVYDYVTNVETITPVAVTGSAAGTVTWGTFTVKKVGKIVTITINNMKHTNDVDVLGAIIIATGLPRPETGRFYLIGLRAVGAYIDELGNFGIDAGFVRSTDTLYGSGTYICAE